MISLSDILKESVLAIRAYIFEQMSIHVQEDKKDGGG